MLVLLEKKSKTIISVGIDQMEESIRVKKELQTVTWFSFIGTYGVVESLWTVKFFEAL